jgi:hypothetical protein
MTRVGIYTLYLNTHICQMRSFRICNSLNIHHIQIVSDKSVDFQKVCILSGASFIMNHFEKINQILLNRSLIGPLIRTNVRTALQLRVRNP